MASEDLNCRDKSPGIWTARKRAPNRTGIVNASAVAGPADKPIPYTLPPVSLSSRIPQFRTQGIQTSGAIKMGNSSDQLIGYQNPNPELDSINGIDNSPFLNISVPDIFCLAREDDRWSQYYPYASSMSAGNVNDHVTQLNSFDNPQIPREFISARNDEGGSLGSSMRDEVNCSDINGSQVIENCESAQGTIPWLCNNPGGGQATVCHNFMGTMEYAERKVPPQSNIPDIGSSLSHDLQMAGSLSSFPNYVNGFSGLRQSMADQTRSDTENGIAHSSPLHVSKSQEEVDWRQRFPMPGNMGSNFVGNLHDRSANSESHQSLHGYLVGTTKPQNGNQAGLPDSSQCGVTGQPLVPRFTCDSTQPAYEKLPETRETSRPFLPESSRKSSFIDLTGGTVWQDQLAVGLQPTTIHHGGAAWTAASGLFSRKTRLQPARKPFPASRGASVQVDEGGLLTRNIGVQQTSNLGQSHAACHLQASKNLHGPGFIKGQEIPAVNGHFPAVVSNASLGPSLKRGAMQTPPATPRVQRRRTKTTQPSSNLYNLNLANAKQSPTLLTQTSPSLPLASQAPPSLQLVAQTTPALPPETQRGQALQHQIQTIPPYQLVTQTPQIQCRTNTTQPSHYPYNPSVATAASSLTPLSHTSSVRSKAHAFPSLPSVPKAYSVLPSQLQRAQVLQRIMQTKSTHPLVSKTAALQRLAKTSQAYPAHVKPSSGRPQSNHVPVVHIKCQDLDTPLLPMGKKCLLCKRDLTFTAEGPVFQPETPPAVAVLPCGHTFHDHCLQVITPKDQAENPPCIPCVIGEN